MIALRQYAQKSIKDETNPNMPVDPAHAHGICAGLCREWLHLRINGNNNAMPNYYQALSKQRAYLDALQIKRGGGYAGVEMLDLKTEFWGGAGLRVTAYRGQQNEISSKIRELNRGTGIGISVVFRHPVHGMAAHAVAVARLPMTGRLRFFDPNGGDKIPGGGEWGFAQGTMMLSNAHEVRNYIRQYYQVVQKVTIFLVKNLR
jgi:hypothetical protein